MDSVQMVYDAAKGDHFVFLISLLRLIVRLPENRRLLRRHSVPPRNDR